MYLPGIVARNSGPPAKEVGNLRVCCAGALHISFSHPESDQQIFSSAKMLPVTWGMAPYRCHAKLLFFLLFFPVGPWEHQSESASFRLVVASPNSPSSTSGGRSTTNDSEGGALAMTDRQLQNQSCGRPEPQDSPVTSWT